MKTGSKTHQIAPFKKMFSEKHATEPPNNRLAMPSPPKVWFSPLQIRHTHMDRGENISCDITMLAIPMALNNVSILSQLLRNIFEEMRS